MNKKDISAVISHHRYYFRRGHGSMGICRQRVEHKLDSGICRRLPYGYPFHCNCGNRQKRQKIKKQRDAAPDPAF